MKNESIIFKTMTYYDILLHTHANVPRSLLKEGPTAYSPGTKTAALGNPSLPDLGYIQLLPQSSTAGGRMMDSGVILLAFKGHIYHLLLGDLDKFPDLCVYKSRLVNLYGTPN